MAIDTRDKRSSAINLTLPWRGMFPAPDGSLDQGDRQHTCNMYRGIEASAGATPSPGTVRVFDTRSHEATVFDATRHTARVFEALSHEVTVFDEDGA